MGSFALMPRVRLKFLTALGFFLFVSVDGMGQPTGFRLKSGSAAAPVLQSDGSLLIRSGKSAYIEWDSFSVSRENALTFLQGASDGVVVNRVVGELSSEILGKIQSNGSIYLINPNGIFIGPSGEIKTAGFIASTLDLLIKDSKELHFQGESGASVINEGCIQCDVGDVFLIGRTVENRGTIQALRQGLLSGCDIVIRSEELSPVIIRPQEAVDEQTFRKNPYALAIRQKGDLRGEKIFLEAAEGVIEAGGDIQAGALVLKGDLVHLEKDARFQAEDVSLYGKNIFINDLAEIESNQTDLFATKIAQIYGNISAKNSVKIVSEDILGFHAKVLAKELTLEAPRFCVQEAPAGVGTSRLNFSEKNSFADLSQVSGDLFCFAKESIDFITSPHQKIGAITVESAQISLSQSWKGNSSFTFRGSLRALSPLNIESKGPLQFFGNVDVKRRGDLVLISEDVIFLDGNVGKEESPGFFSVRGAPHWILGPKATQIYAGSVEVFTPILLNGSTDINTSFSGGSITCHREILGQGSLSLSAGTGIVSALQNIDIKGNFSILSAFQVHMGSELGKVCVENFKVGVPVSVTLARDLSLKASKEVSFGGTVNGSCNVDISAQTVAFEASMGGISPLKSVQVAAEKTVFGENATKICLDSLRVFGENIEFPGRGKTSISSQKEIVFDAQIVGSDHRKISLEAPSAHFTKDINGGSFDLSAKTIMDGKTFSIEGIRFGKDSAVAFTNSHIFLHANQEISFGSSVSISPSAQVSFSAETILLSSEIQKIEIQSLALSAKEISAHNLEFYTPVDFIGNQSTTFKAQQILFYDALRCQDKRHELCIEVTKPLYCAHSLNVGSLEIRAPEVKFGPEAKQILAERFDAEKQVIFCADKIEAQTQGLVFGGGFESCGKVDLDAGSGAIYFGGDISIRGDFCCAASSVTLGKHLRYIDASSLFIEKQAGFYLQGRGEIKIDTHGGDIFFSGPVDGSANLRILGGEVAFLSNIGQRIPLGNLSLEKTRLAVFESGVQKIAVRSFRIDQGTPAMFLSQGKTLLQAEGSVLFSGPVDGNLPEAHSLRIEAKETQFLQNIGEVLRLGSLDVCSDQIVFAEAVNLLNVRSLSLSSDAQFLAESPISIRTDGDISFAGSIAAQADLCLQSDRGGVSVCGDITAKHFSVLSDQKAAFGGAFIKTSSFTVKKDSFFDRMGSTVLQSSGNILFQNAVDGPADLTLQTPESVCFASFIGKQKPLGDLKVYSEKGVEFSQSIEARSLQVNCKAPAVFLNSSYLATQKDVLFSGELSGQNISISSREGCIEFLENIHCSHLLIEKGKSVLFSENVHLLDVTGLDIVPEAHFATESMTIRPLEGAVSFKGSLHAKEVFVSRAGDCSFCDMHLSKDLFIEGRKIALNGHICANNIVIYHDDVLTSAPGTKIVLGGNFEQKGPGSSLFAGEMRCENSVHFSKGLAFSSATSIYSGNEVLFQEELDGPGSLSVEGKRIYFRKSVGEIPLSGLQVSAEVIEMDADQQVGSGDMVYAGKILLSQPIQFIHKGKGSVSFSSSSTTLSSQNDCSIFASFSPVLIQGDVDLGGTDEQPHGSRFLLVGGGDVSVQGKISTQGNALFNGNGGEVSISSQNGSISVGEIVASGAPCAKGGSIYLCPSGKQIDHFPVGILTLNGELTSLPLSGKGGDIYLSAHRTSPARVATITSGLRANPLRIRSKSCCMGPFESMTGLGNIDFHCQTMTLGNIVAAKEMSLQAKTIQLQTVRSQESIQFLSGGNYTRIGEVVPEIIGFTEDSVNLQSEQFNLLLNGQILNFNPNFLSSTPEVNYGATTIYLLNVACAQLSDFLPIYELQIPTYLQSRKPMEERKTEKNPPRSSKKNYSYSFKP